MRLSQLFGKTQREIPSEADTASHQLLLRAGMIMQVAAGVYSYMPLGWRVLKKIENIIREEMDNAGGQELAMPVLQPVELWQQTGRDQSFGKGLFTLLDRRERTLVLGPTHEEVLTQMVSHHVQSYRDLPKLLYQIQTKFRDEPRPRGGLIRVREFIMKDLYSFDVGEDELDVSYQKMVQAYRNIYDRCALPALFIEADSGAIGGKDSHEFMLIAENGEDEVICCDSCEYSANAEKAISVKRQIKPEKPQPLGEVATPGMKTIEELANFLKVPKDHTLKAVFYVADGQVVFAMIRGDLDVNEVKLQRLLKCTDLHLATEDEVSKAGISAGYASPMGLKGIKIVADDSVTEGINFVAGGNKPDIHIKNVNYPRDFKADIVADIARVGEGDACPKCGGMLKSMQGIEIGHVFKLGTFLSNALGANFVDEKGDSRPIIMGCYGIGLGRLLAAAVEHYHDDKGIIWPLSIAPYQVYLCPLYREGTNVAEAAEKLYSELQSAGLEVLFDDREESPGVKFNDADLLGIPLRVTVGPRTLQNSNVEVKWRAEKEAALVPVAEAVARVKELVKAR
ncbi:MAG: proline--tRNA ligase [Dehalococcoidales bacterium]|nr:proline--tRNA ligase [Dehalococcoidales bacterium]